MSSKAFTPAQIVKKLGQVKRLIAGGKPPAVACKRAGVTEQVYRRWRKDYGALAKRLMALEHGQKTRDRNLAESLEQQTVTSEILRIISGSPTATQPVFDAIVKSGVRLFGGLEMSLRLVKGDHTELMATTEAGVDSRNFSTPLDDERRASTRAILRREVVQIADILAEEWVPEATKERAKRRGHRAVLHVPMLRENTAIGALSVYRATPAPFTNKEVALLQTFADQAVIAIENVRLFNETKEALEHQTATSEILRIISASSTETQPVFDAIVKSVAHLFGSVNASLRLVKGDRSEMVASTSSRRETPEDFPVPLDDAGIPASRAILRRDIVHSSDIFAEEWISPGIKQRAELRGFRAILVAPMLREGNVIGTINVNRATPGPFTDKEIALLRTFADQAVIAIENVRLFNDTKEALEQQTATSDILRIISGSLTDTQPVFDAIVRNCANLFVDSRVGLWLISNDWLHPRASTGETIREPMPVDRGSGTGVCVLDGHIVHMPDLEKAAEQYPRLRQLALKFGYHSGIYAPLLRDGRAIGAISVVRRETGAFDEKEVALLNTFADQAVIAIENVRLFNEIEDKSRQLQVASQHKSEFLANMSHELRTPLNAVIGFSEVLGERMFGELTDKQAEYVNDIHTSGAHLLSLINDILDLSKVEAGRMELDVSAFSVPLAIDNALTLIKERAGRHGIELACVLDPALGDIHADERKLKQILLNLLSNAVKFTPDGGRISVAANSIPGGVQISVADTGVGIAPEDCAAVFEEFRQVGQQSAAKAEGTGLGLALARKFVELHGGKIGVASVPGQGSTFTFSLMDCSSRTA
ncbi:MAG: GAF domain-containing protein [Lysobacterales bacterium]